MLKALRGNFSKGFELCASAPEAYRAICYQGIGRDASGQTISNVEKTKKICLLGEAGIQQEQCVMGAVKDFVSYFHSDTAGEKLCNAFDEDIRASCLATVKAYYSIF
jgi:hypothetical protein